jgi:hypothetical protein
MKTDSIDETKADPERYNRQLSNASKTAKNDPKLGENRLIQSTHSCSFHFESHETKTDSINETKADPERYNRQLSNASKTVKRDPKLSENRPNQSTHSCCTLLLMPFQVSQDKH